MKAYSIALFAFAAALFLALAGCTSQADKGTKEICESMNGTWDACKTWEQTCYKYTDGDRCEPKVCTPGCTLPNATNNSTGNLPPAPPENRTFECPSISPPSVQLEESCRQQGGALEPRRGANGCVYGFFCNSSQSPPAPPEAPSARFGTKSLCEAAHGRWNECPQVNCPEGVACTQVCTPKCEFACAGIANLQCPDGYVCTGVENYPDAGGICVQKASEPQMSKELCESARGSWNECASACRGAPEGTACIMMCVQQCECGGIAGFGCPSGYYCTDYLPSASTPDAMGVCKKI